MSETVTVETQGISADYGRATGDYEAVARGTMDAAALLALMERVRGLEVPEEERFNDYCPPHVMTEGPAGRFSFMMDGGAIYCDETECEIAPAEAADLATGRQTVAAVTARHAGESGTAFVQGPERAQAEAEARAARAARAAANAPRPVGLARRLLGYGIALGFLLAGLGTLGAGLEEATGDDLYAALFMGGLLVLIGALIGFAVRRAATRGVRTAAARGGGGGFGRRDDRWDDDDRRDDDRRDDDRRDDDRRDDGDGGGGDDGGDSD
jgi:hypothetical protein